MSTELIPTPERRVFEWLQTGDVRMKGDYYVSSMNGWMYTIPDGMIGKKIEQGAMPVFRPLIIEGQEPLDFRDTVISPTAGELDYGGYKAKKHG